MQKVAPDFTFRSSEAALEAPLAGAHPVLGGIGIGRRLGAIVARASDGQLALLISAVLFLLAAWPLALVDVPPFQDLPNHLATITVIEHPQKYPEFVFNGFFKTNSAFFTWLLFVGRLVGTKMAAKVFTLLVLALNAGGE
jgi:hypothetical protein